MSDATSLLYSYSALFGLSFLAATVIPMSSEPPLIYLVTTEQHVVLPVLIGTAGNVLGACTTYWISRRAAQALAEKRKPARGHARAAQMLRRYGQPALLLSWVPILGDALVAIAGATKMHFGAFCFWVSLGKGLRYLLIALATMNLL
jgi:membrane protein YqaA with SNARE-associated domain